MLKKLIRRMLIAQMLSSMTVTFCLLIDSILTGRFLGPESMSAYGYGAPILMCFSAIGNMICAGSQVICGRTMGVGDREGTNACFSAAVFLSLVVSVIGCLGVFAFPDQICVLLGVGANSAGNPVFPLTKDYIRGFALGAPAFMMQQIMVPYMQMSGKRKKLLVAIGAMSIGDILFDLLNIYVFHMGILGMGLASALSYYIAAAFIVSALLKKDGMFRFRLQLVGLKISKAIFREGLPVLVNQICLVLLPLFRNNMLTFYAGSVAVAAYSVISSVSNVCFSLCAGINSVALTLSSVSYAEKDKRALKESMLIIFKYGIVIYLVIDWIILLITKPIVMLYTKDMIVADMALLGLKLAILSYIPCVLNGILKNYYQGIGHTKLTMAICAMQNFVISAICALILGRFFNVTGVWLSIACGELLTMLIVFIYISIKNRRLSFKPEDFLLLSEDYGIDEDDCFDIAIHDQAGAITASERAAVFCSNRGMSKKTSMFISLMIEELANNIIEFGFIDGKPHSIDVRIVKENKLLLRVRDDCSSFDPVKYMELHQDDDPVSHIGIRLVMRLAKDARYENSLGLNNLILTL